MGCSPVTGVTGVAPSLSHARREQSTAVLTPERQASLGPSVPQSPRPIRRRAPGPFQAPTAAPAADSRGHPGTPFPICTWTGECRPRLRPWLGSTQLPKRVRLLSNSWLVEQAVLPSFSAQSHSQDPAEHIQKGRNKPRRHFRCRASEQVRGGQAAQPQAWRPLRGVRRQPGDLPCQADQQQSQGPPHHFPRRALPEQMVLIFGHSLSAVGAVQGVPQPAGHG